MEGSPECRLEREDGVPLRAHTPSKHRPHQVREQLHVPQSSTSEPTYRPCYIVHAYHWFYRLLLFEETNLVADSGNVYDATLRGGKLGVFSFSQEGVIWSDLVYRCNGNSTCITFLYSKDDT